jgi:two-component system sensor histidine kinase YesM
MLNEATSPNLGPEARSSVQTAFEAQLATDRRSWPFLSRLRLSIRSKILAALLFVVCLMSIPYVVLTVPGLAYKRQYDSIIENITTANSINGHVKQSIDTEMWNIVAGKQSFGDGQQYAIINDVNHRLDQMIDNTDSQRGKIKLQVIKRTLETLQSLIDQVGLQIAQGKSFDQNMVLLEEIRRVSQLVEDNVQEYALFEVERTEQQYHIMQESLTRWALSGLAVFAASILFSILAAWYISKSIYVPIKKLHDVTKTIGQQDLEVLLTSRNADEITELGLSFNLMVGRVRSLLDAKLQEQEALKKAELRALQAQINPHFLYNTLDAIIWMAEANRKAQVVDLVRALSRFFRITLSKGRDWISLADEFAHVESYLIIQQMRYRDILDYRIEVAEEVLHSKMLKLTLQPLVENALYHGIKHKRSGGIITVTAQRLDAQRLRIDVHDNGIGIPADKLEEIRSQLSREASERIVSESGYGISNVNQRVRLYYGPDYGLTIESQYQQGTRVSLILPIQPISTPLASEADE